MDIHKYRHGAKIRNRFSSGNERERCCDDLVPALDSCGAKRKVQGVCTGGNGNGMFTPWYVATSSSSAFTFGPRMNCELWSTLRMALLISSLIPSYWIFRSTMGTVMILTTPLYGIEAKPLTPFSIFSVIIRARASALRPSIPDTRGRAPSRMHLIKARISSSNVSRLSREMSCGTSSGIVLSPRLVTIAFCV